MKCRRHHLAAPSEEYEKSDAEEGIMDEQLEQNVLDPDRVLMAWNDLCSIHREKETKGFQYPAK